MITISSDSIFLLSCHKKFSKMDKALNLSISSLIYFKQTSNFHFQFPLKSLSSNSLIKQERKKRPFDLSSQPLKHGNRSKKYSKLTCIKESYNKTETE